MKRLAVIFAFLFLGASLSGNACLADSANDHFNNGFAKHQTGDLKTAIKHYSNAIEDNPGFVMAYQMRAAAWQRMRQFSKAINDYSMVISLGEPYFQAVGYLNRGIVKNMAGDYFGAIPDFSQAILLDRRLASAYFHRGIAKSKTGDVFGKYEDFRQAARLGDFDAEKWLDQNYPSWRQFKS
jgi:tetratricopeptide (TPR) repeat protein